MATVNPYIAVLEQLNKQQEEQTAAANTAAQSQLQNAYIDKMQTQKSLGETLASQGITGGATESATLGTNLGYQRNKNTINKNLQDAIADINSTIEANKTTVQTQSAEWEQARQAEKEQRFANTITGYNTVSSCDKAIEDAQESGETWKIPYLRAQRAALLEQQKQEAAYSGGGTTTTTTTTGGSGTSSNTSSSSGHSSRVSDAVTSNLPVLLYTDQGKEKLSNGVNPSSVIAWLSNLKYYGNITDSQYQQIRNSLGV